MTRELAAFLCPHVFDQSRPILVVSREGGDWQFLCGDEHQGRPHVVGVNHIFDRDATLAEVRDLPIDWEAERTTAEAPWRRRKIE